MRFSYAIKLLVFAIACSTHFTSMAEDQYNGRTLEEWLNSPKRDSIPAFREAGTNSFPFLLEQLNGPSYHNRFAALMIISESFDRSQIENSIIETKLRAILVHGGQGEQIEAYAAIRKLGLNVPASEIAAAASTCPSIKASEYQAAEQSKLPRLYSMTNSVDCDYIATLINEPDPQIPMQTFGFLCQLERTNGTELCAAQIVSAFAIMVTNNTDPSALRNAVAYIAIKPERIHDNLDSITTLLEQSSDDSLLLSCESLLFALPSGETLPPRTCQALESLKARSATNAEVSREADTLLTSRCATNKP